MNLIILVIVQDHNLDAQTNDMYNKCRNFDAQQQSQAHKERPNKSYILCIEQDHVHCKDNTKEENNKPMNKKLL